MAGHSLQVVTLNVWGLPDLPFKKLSPFRGERIEAVCAELRQEAADPDGWDVVLLQEAWLKKDRARLKNSGFEHAVDLDDWRPLDSGLLILSRHPISRETRSRLRFSSGGHLGKSFEDGEFFASKSGIMARIDHPVVGGVWIVNTHLIAQYTGRKEDIYLPIRKRQLGELVAWVLARTGEEPTVLGGDLNFGPGSEEWSYLEERLPGFVEAPNAAEIFTLDRDCPTQAARHSIPGGHKVDHLVASPHFHAANGQLTFDRTVKVAGRSMRVSDHFGLHTRFHLRPEAAAWRAGVVTAPLAQRLNGAEGALVAPL